MAKFLVYIETKGDSPTNPGPVAHVPSLPGATARGKTIDEAKENIRQAVEEYLRLLRGVGEPVVRVSEGLSFEFEEVDGTTFPTDFDPLHPNELEALLRWMAVSRQELVDLVRDLPEDALTWKPDADSRSIRDILFHLAEADVWYTDRLKQWPEAPLFRLAAARSVALERLRAATNTDANTVTTHDGEEWTPRKIVRRMLEHEREHIQQIRAMLTEMKAKK